MKKILITGAFGFVGGNLSASLKNNGYYLIALDLTNNHTSNEYHTTYNWDQINEINWQDVDIIIHLAGKAHDLKNTSDAQSYFDINLGLTQKIYDRFLNSSATKFIFFSSVKAAKDSLDGSILTEDIQPTPETPYGKSKLMAEEYIKSKHIPNSKRAVILRPAMIHGPNNKGNLNLLYSLVSRGLPYPLGAYDNKRSFTSIENLTYIVNKIIDQEIPSGVYNVADDEPLSTSEIVDLIARSVQRRPRIFKVNRFIVEMVAKVGNFVSFLPLNTDRLTKLIENFVVSNDKIKQVLNIKSLPITNLDGMMKTINSFRNIDLIKIES